MFLDPYCQNEFRNLPLYIYIYIYIYTSLKKLPLDPYEPELPEETLDPYAKVEVSYHMPVVQVFFKFLYGFYRFSHVFYRFL